MSEENPLLDRLPEFYQSQGGDLFRRYVGIGEGLLEGLEQRSSQSEDDLLEVARSLRPRRAGKAISVEDRVDSQGVDSQGVDSQGVDSQGVDLQGVDSQGVDLQGVDSQGGTEAGLAAWFRSIGKEPWVWPALHVVRDVTGCLRFTRTWRRLVVLAWSRDDVPAILDARSFLERLIPPGCAVQGVWLERPPKLLPPLSGSVLRGGLLF